MSGNKALAKELGIKGRWCCDRMKDCHTIASEAIFQERNKCLRAGKTSGSVVLDLHGLHVSEAQRILRRELDLLSQSGASSQTISLLVGTGHHTKVGYETDNICFELLIFISMFCMKLKILWDLSSGSSHTLSASSCCVYFLGDKWLQSQARTARSNRSQIVS